MSAQKIDVELVRLHNLPTGTNEEKMATAKETIAFYEERGWDWVQVVTYIITWDKSPRGCVFCGKKGF